MTDRNGGYPATSPFAGGNPRPRNPGPSPVTCDPRSPPSVAPSVASVAVRPRINTDMFPFAVPPGSPSRGLKPLT
jgi:hypothetical protein